MRKKKYIPYGYNGHRESTGEPVEGGFRIRPFKIDHYLNQDGTVRRFQSVREKEKDRPLLSVFQVRYFDYFTNKQSSEYKITSEY